MCAVRGDKYRPRRVTWTAEDERRLARRLARRPRTRAPPTDRPPDGWKIPRLAAALRRHTRARVVRRPRSEPRLRAPSRVSRRTRARSPRSSPRGARHAPDRPRPTLRDFSSSRPALHRPEFTTFSRDDDPRARIRRRRRPRQRPRSRSRAPRAHSRPRHARARPGNPGRTGATHPPRLRPGITTFPGVCRPPISRVAARTRARFGSLSIESTSLSRKAPPQRARGAFSSTNDVHPPSSVPVLAARSFPP